jgi:hypothetical protein
MTMPLQAGLATAGRLNGAAIGTKALASATHTDSTTSFSAAMAAPSLRDLDFLKPSLSRA